MTTEERLQDQDHRIKEIELYLANLKGMISGGWKTLVVVVGLVAFAGTFLANLLKS